MLTVVICRTSSADIALFCLRSINVDYVRRLRWAYLFLLVVQFARATPISVKSYRAIKKFELQKHSSCHFLIFRLLLFFFIEWFRRLIGHRSDSSSLCSFCWQWQFACEGPSGDVWCVRTQTNRHSMHLNEHWAHCCWWLQRTNIPQRHPRILSFSCSFFPSLPVFRYSLVADDAGSPMHHAATS